MTHDVLNDIFHCFILVTLSFILGHKVAARSARRHLEEMEKIWKKTP